MCWKHEWARAINNLNRAIAHVVKAREKMQKRLLRNERNLRRLRQNKKYNYPSQLTPVQMLIEKNRRAIHECNQIIARCKQMEDSLFIMVHVHGIKRGDSSKVYQLMGKYDFERASELHLKEEGK